MNSDEQKQQIVLAGNLGQLEGDREYDAFARLQSVKEFETKTGKPFLVLDLADLSGTVSGKIWSDAADAMEAARAATPGCFVKVRGRTQVYQGNLQLIVSNLKIITANEAPKGFDPDQLIDPALAQVEDLICRTLVFDIETVPALDRRELPSTVAEALSDNAAKKEMDTSAVMGDAVLETIVVKDVRKARRNKRAETKVIQCPWRVFARRTAAKVPPCNQDGPVIRFGLIQHKVRPQVSIRVKAPVMKQMVAQAVSRGGRQEARGDNLVCIDVRRRVVGIDEYITVRTCDRHRVAAVSEIDVDPVISAQDVHDIRAAIAPNRQRGRRIEYGQGVVRVAEVEGDIGKVLEAHLGVHIATDDTFRAVTVHRDRGGNHRRDAQSIDTRACDQGRCSGDERKIRSQ